MSDPVVVTAVAGAYLATCILVGTLPGRRSSDSAAGYVAGDRTLGLLLMYFITGATIFSAFAFLGAPGYAYKRGAAAFHILAYGAFGFLPFYFLGPRAARLGRSHGFITQAEMMAARYGSRTLSGLLTIVSLCAWLPYLALQMRGAGQVLEVMTAGTIDARLGGALVYGVVLLYVWKSGVLGVGWTNVFQGLLMLALAWGLGIYLPRLLYGGIGPMFQRIAESEPELLRAPGLAGGGVPWSWSRYVSTVLVLTTGFCAWPHLFMKAFSARDLRTIRRSVVLYPTFQLFLLPLFIIGFAGVHFASAPAAQDQILPHILMHSGIAPVWIGLFCAGALAASMSTGDAILHAACSSIVRDGWISALGRPLTPHVERRAIRCLLVPMLLVAYAIAFASEKDLVSRLQLAYGPVTQIFPALVATLYWRGASEVGVVAGLALGTGVALVFGWHPDWMPWDLHEGIYGLALNVPALVLFSKLFPSARERSEAYLRVAAGGDATTPAPLP